jgi:hypothetical protein
MKLLSFLLVLFLVIFFCACQYKPVDVVIDKSFVNGKKSKIVIDDKITIAANTDTTLAVKLMPGEHFVKVNDSAKQLFTVPEEGGLLNLSNNEYVVYEIKYAASTSGGFDMDKMRVKSVILIDSFVIIPNSAFFATDSSLRKQINYLIDNNEGRQATNKNTNVNGLLKTGKGQLFINKFWDYNMTDKIPQSLTVRTNNSFGTNSTTRTSILRARLFLLSVLMSGQDEYRVKSLQQIREGSEDKKKEKELKSKQMEF